MFHDSEDEMTQVLDINDIEICERVGATLDRKEVITLATLYAHIFAERPWRFDWERYVDDPDNPNSAVTFLETLISYGATLFIGTHRPTKEVVGYLIILTLTDRALEGILSDLKTQGNAQAGDVYLAGFGNLPHAQKIGLGKRFMLEGLRWGGNRRFWLRTRPEAEGMVSLSVNTAKMRVHKKYMALQAGAEYERLLFVRDPAA